MAFLVYSVQPAGKWRCESEVVLTRTLAEHARSILPTEKPEGWWEYPWSQSDEELLSKIRASLSLAPGNHNLVVDLKPKDRRLVSLYQIEKIWGITTPTWTPIAVRLCGLVVDEKKTNPAKFKECFEANLNQPEHSGIHEFLYLRHEDGPETAWNWGRVGSVNAALLWPQMFDHFVKEIRKEHKARGDQCQVSG